MIPEGPLIMKGFRGALGHELRRGESENRDLKNDKSKE